ncbi:MAG: hypothetical protein CMO41_00050 [Verrucomicrobiales bacterium]|nr:hypothetical protein [Verrucomicrobiales bacterium]
MSIQSRKISMKAAEKIADTFVNSGDMKKQTDTLWDAQDAADQALQKRIVDYAMNSPARKFFDNLSPKIQFGDDTPAYLKTSTSFPVRIDKPELTYSSTIDYDTEVYKYDWHNQTDPRKHTPDAWWWFDIHALEICRIIDPQVGADLDLRKYLSKKLCNHKLLIAYVQAYEEWRAFQEDINRLWRRIKDDIHGRSVKQVLTAWPELSEAVQEYYGTQPNKPTASPLVTPLSQVISECTTPMITKEAS